MGMLVVIVLKGNRQIIQGRLVVRPGHVGDVVALHVFTKLSAIPLLCGLHTGVVSGTNPIWRAKLRVCSSV